MTRSKDPGTREKFVWKTGDIAQPGARQSRQIVTVNSSPGVTIGQAANQAAQSALLEDYRARKSAQTLRRQSADIALFERFLSVAGVAAAGLADNLALWSLVSWGLVEAFNRWQLTEGYAIGSINVRLATVKMYCQLATKAGYLSEQEYALISAAKTISHGDGVNLDAKRAQTRQSTKKAQPTPLKPAHVDLLKEWADARDRLMICLLFDHALRCGEVAALDIADIELDTTLSTGLLHITSLKTKEQHIAALTPDTYTAALAYLATRELAQGPLFVGKISGERISERSIYHRVRLLGQKIGLQLAISPHDGRHFFADDAFSNNNDLATIQQAGRWKSSAMPLKYATERKIINQGLKLTSTRRANRSQEDM